MAEPEFEAQSQSAVSPAEVLVRAKNTVGRFSLVLSIVAVLFAIPRGGGLFSWTFAIPSFVLGIIGVSGGRRPKTASIVGIILSVAALPLGVNSAVSYSNWYSAQFHQGCLGPKIDKKYCSFDPIHISGSGNETVELPFENSDGNVAVPECLLIATYEGSGNFEVRTFDKEKREPAYEVVMSQGKYSGTTTFGGTNRAGHFAQSLKISADGPWTITVESIDNVAPFTAPSNGTGDMVFLYTGPAPSWTLTNVGEGESSLDESSIVQGTEPVQAGGDSSVRLEGFEGPALLIIKSTDEWIIK
jgi:hypothetical protein